MNEQQTITITVENIALLFDKLLDIYRYANRPDYERIIRSEMEKIIDSRATYERAVKEGFLTIHKDDNAGQFSEVWAVHRDFKRFLKKHLPERYEKYYTRKL